MSDKIEGLMNQLINGDIETHEVLDALCGYVQGEIEIYQDRSEEGEGDYRGEIADLKLVLSLVTRAYQVTRK